MKENERLHKIMEQKDKLNDLIQQYWDDYSGIGTWYFWFNMICVIIPLLILYKKIDRNRIFEICFFGYTVHVLWSNVDSVLSSMNYLIHPHTLSSFLPVGITLTAVLLPVAFMFVYQYCTNRGKYFYLYVILLSMIFAFIFAPISKAFNLLTFFNGMNYFYLFLIDVVIAIIAYWLTRFFANLQRKE
ncbi:hypothetical protein CHH83_13910 [Bacillus sp. 7586-K]|uniref:Magnesium-transporting ATPase (P-type) n=1 Tax=Metabacillus niabensis TaxID=324854 RepID=A0ABT9YX39_9BACI|nr:hypothetical protein [Metabacillus niabensis]MDQ0224284.1 magnesium-transporting ATPase (P-type) [Metabacillus niabensis]PAD68414.1 hypothetical protein CHH83_13910 [Bacillus sp. 7586-K]